MKKKQKNGKNLVIMAKNKVFTSKFIIVLKNVHNK